MQRSGWRHAAAGILAVALLLSAVASCLPDNEYQRWQLLARTSQRRVLWIYERLHDNPAPIDLAFIGVSRLGAALNVPRLRDDLAAAGVRVNVTDLSLPESGRDLHWVIAQQLLAAKPPKLLVIGIIEQPSRVGHPGFKYIAPARDIVNPAYFGNANYLANLIYLPYRQLYLAAASVFPATFGLAPAYDPRHPATDNAAQLWKSRLIMPTPELERRARVYRRGVTPPRLGPRFADEEFGDERAYIRKIAAAAKARGVPIAFVFLPYYGGPSRIRERAFYASMGPVFDASFVSKRADYFYNLAHVNERGSAAVTDWLAPQLAPLLAEPLSVANDANER